MLHEDIEFKIEFTKNITHNLNCTVIFVDENFKVYLNNDTINAKYQHLITATLNDKKIYKPTFGNIKLLTISESTSSLQYLMLVGLGKDKDLTKLSFEKLGGKIFQYLSCHKIASANIIFDQYIEEFTSSKICTLLANGFALASYKFDKYFTTKKDEDKFTFQHAIFITEGVIEAQESFAANKAVLEGIFLARNCISEPGNILYPESYANIINQALNIPGVTIDILSLEDMKKLGMGALLGVAQGSVNEPKLVTMHYRGNVHDAIPIALVGKGVTFDTGGISIKPRTNMGDMKYDMGGSAAVIGTIKALALRQANINIVGVVGLVENMPGGNAQRPGDVVTTMSGKTAEVVDTDAEGRLVLADAVWYTQVKFKPNIVIDLATLTGAIGVALGNTYAGLFANDDELADMLLKAGEKAGEKLWRMPLHQDFEDMIKSPIADVSNLGDQPGKAGSSTAAHFIKNFIQEDIKWAHLDIANMAWLNKNSDICPKGAVGFGVRLLNQFIQDNYE